MGKEKKVRAWQSAGDSEHTPALSASPCPQTQHCCRVWAASETRRLGKKTVKGPGNGNAECET